MQRCSWGKLATLGLLLSLGFLPGDAHARALPVVAEELFRALSEEGSQDTVAPLLAEALQGAGAICAKVQDYQVYSATAGYRTLKVKCAEQPLFALTVQDNGQIQIAGGDGSVQPFNPNEGPVVTILGVRADAYLSEQRRKGNLRVASESEGSRGAHSVGLSMPNGRTGESGRLLASPLSIIIFNLLVALIFGAAVIKAVRRRRGDDEVSAFTSELKDQLIEDSQEILPDIFQHADGLFIVKGRKGKRRVFKVLFFAYIYKSYGIKIFECR